MGADFGGNLRSSGITVQRSEQTLAATGAENVRHTLLNGASNLLGVYLVPACGGRETILTELSDEFPAYLVREKRPRWAAEILEQGALQCTQRAEAVDGGLGAGGEHDIDETVEL